VPPEPVERRASWFDCASDADCTIVADASCSFASVNRRHIDEFQHYVRYEMLRVRRDRPCRPRGAPDYAPVCVDAKCSSRRPQ
jgi:hypothetical protein